MRYSLSLRQTVRLLLILLPFLPATAYFASASERPADDPITLKTAHHELTEILKDPLFHRWKLRQEEALKDKAPPMELSEEIRKTLIDWADSAGKSLRKFWRWFSWDSSPKREKSWFSFDGLSRLGGSLRLTGWILLTLLLCGLSILLIRHYRAIVRPVQAASILSRRQIKKALEDGEALALEGKEWLAVAEDMARSQELRAVYRALYLALLSGLHQRGKIVFRANRTNWTYVTHFRGQKEDQHSFATLTEEFDRIWYGEKIAEGTLLPSLRAQIDALLGKEEDHA